MSVTTQKPIKFGRLAGSGDVRTRNLEWKRAKQKLDLGLLLSTAEVAVLMGVTPNTILIWVEKKKLVAEKSELVSVKGSPVWTFLPENIKIALDWAEFKE